MADAIFVGWVLQDPDAGHQPGQKAWWTTRGKAEDGAGTSTNGMLMHLHTTTGDILHALNTWPVYLRRAGVSFPGMLLGQSPRLLQRLPKSFQARSWHCDCKPCRSHLRYRIKGLD
jgi:hypothetical protein